MAWSRFWIDTGKKAAERRRLAYGLTPPPSVARLLRRDPPALGLWGSLLMMLYVVIGSPRGAARVVWWHLTDRDTPRRRRLLEGHARALRPALSQEARVLVGYFERRLYSRDVARVPRALEKSLHRTTPLLVVQAREEADVVATLAFARAQRLPVYPRGVSSSPFGGAVPTTNGIVLDLSPMMSILGVDAERRTARLQPGVRWADLDASLAPHALGLYTTPTSRFSTVAGWACTGGLGINGFGHGHLSAAVAGARVVLPDGELRVLKEGDPRLGLFMGAEGTLGVLTELTLKVRPRPALSRAHLIRFDTTAAAFAFIDKLAHQAHGPSHVAFYSEERLAEENHLFRDRTGRDEPVVDEQPSALLHLEDPEGLRVVSDLAREAGATLREPDPAAAYLWAERFFPLKAQRLGPSLLASEVVLPLAAIPRFITQGQRLARRFGTALGVEVFVSRTDEGLRGVTIGAFTCSARHRLDYLLRLLLVQLLTRLAVKLGGRPYGFGIWNSPFMRRGDTGSLHRERVTLKRAHDPDNLLNPMKLFRLRTTFSLPGVLFMGPVFRGGLFFAHLLSPVLGLIARGTRAAGDHRWQVPPVDQEHGYALASEASLRCTYCGACISTCPAYLITGDELVTGRAKLRLAEAVISGEEVTAKEAHSPFQCLRCGLCEEVCQTALPLRDCYEVVERWVAERHGYPKELVERFVSRVDGQRDRYLWAYGLSRPPWVPAPEAAEPIIEAADDDAPPATPGGQP